MADTFLFAVASILSVALVAGVLYGVIESWLNSQRRKGISFDRRDLEE